MSWLSGKTSYKSANMGEDHKKEGGTTNSSSHKKNNYTKTTFTAPTTGLEDVVFDYGTGCKPGEFKNNVDHLAEYLATHLKYEGPTLAKAIKSRKVPVFEAPKDLTKDEEDKMTRRALKEYDTSYETAHKGKTNWKNNNEIAFSKFLSHCTPSMRGKLQGMETWTVIEEKMDGLGLIKLLQDITFQQDGSKQSILEIVEAVRSLYVCFQRKDQSLEDYTKEFKMRLQVIETLGISVGEDNASVKLICAEEGLDWTMVLSNQAKLKEYKKNERQIRCCAPL